MKPILLFVRGLINIINEASKSASPTIKINGKVLQSENNDSLQDIKEQIVKEVA